MCGIVGYVGQQNAVPIILEGLKRLEYRGYDSAGIATIDADAIQMRRDVGKLINLQNRISESPIKGQIGIGHTRWATHGVPAERNAHPHISMNQDFVVVHNGIVENFQELKSELRAEGIVFQSETDTEVIVQLIERYAHNGARGNLTEATRQAVSHLDGAHAIVVMSRETPDQLVAVRIGNAGGVAVGIGEHENYVASDVPAILEHTRNLIFLESHQIATITPINVHIQTLDGETITPTTTIVPWDPVSAAKGEYKHFMQKEIFEQPRAVTDTIGGRVDFERAEVYLPELNLVAEQLERLTRLVIVACGTSYYSGLVGKFYIERLSRLHVEVDYASEYRYREPILDDRTALLAITQSGETVDTLAAIEQGREQNALIWSIVNGIGSQAMRIADGYIAMNAGPEIGVASTKAFVTSIVDQYLLALHLAQHRQTLTRHEMAQHIHHLARLPDLMGKVLDLDPIIHDLASKLYHFSDFLYVGRGINYPIALEGALKLKEISYIHAEGYPAGEMKHGPIALIDEEMPVLAVAVQDALYPKMISQIEQAKSRGAIVVAIASEGDDAIKTKVDHVIPIPSASEFINPILAVIPMQMLAYHIAVWRGADVDQPRNLAKSVTVE